jgi:ankyrin repeat protein
LPSTCDFADRDFSNVNACSSDGDYALLGIVRGGDLSAAKTLREAGVEVNKAGDPGYTPLHVACIKGNADIVKLLDRSRRKPICPPGKAIPLSRKLNSLGTTSSVTC